jgi:hypothetical protein
LYNYAAENGSNLEGQGGGTSHIIKKVEITAVYLLQVHLTKILAARATSPIRRALAREVKIPAI